MNPSRWLPVQLLVALSLLVAVLGALGNSASAASVLQTDAPAEEAALLPAPTAGWLKRPAISPTANPTSTLPVTTSSEVGGEVSDEVSATVVISGVGEVTVTMAATYYVVARGDTLSVIAREHGTTVDAMVAANDLTDANVLDVGQVLLIPASDGTLPDPVLTPVVTAEGALTETVIAPRGTITERMTSFAQQSSENSPFYNTTWLSYYGRPHIDVMGILGEFSIAELTPLLREAAASYEQANGDSLKVMPAFHLVYGMATRAPGDDSSHLAYIEESEVISYIEAAQAEGWSVILDVQIGALTPSEAISPALAYLSYPNVHLAIDPEFAMVHEGQAVPGNPIGFVTAEQVNEVQRVIESYLEEKQLPGPRVLLVHQFQSNMIEGVERLDAGGYPNVALTLSVDGWGGPWGKISKYNSLVSTASPYTAFKLFYRWDEPLLLPEEALGNRPYGGSDFAIDVTPNLIIYQ